jgi:hypothetical protein
MRVTEGTLDSQLMADDIWRFLFEDLVALKKKDF